MKKQFSLLFVTFLLISTWSWAQQGSVSGVVTSADDGLPIPGVTVMIKNTLSGTITDVDGNYKLDDVPLDSTIVFSFIGMKTREFKYIGQATLDVVMEPEAVGLDEFVVIGYGTVKKRDLTGSVTTVDSKTITSIQPVKVEEALQGTMTGVNVTPQSGSPGAGLDIRIRGVSTNVDPSPVVIIDGYVGDLNTINPNDIETITVLKDAQAAIYGTIGANGIILVTTKSGKRNTPLSASFNSSFGIQETTRTLPLLDATEYAVILNESYAANGQELPYPDVSGLGKGTDWQEELFSTAPMYDNNLSFSGGTEKVNYAFSASDLRQKGIIGGDKAKYNRTTARVALGADLTNWLKFNTNIQYAHIYRNSFNDFGLGSVLFNAVNMPSVYPVYDETGDYFLAPTNLGIEIINPLQQIANTYNDYDLDKWNGTLGLEASFARHFTATARLGFNTSNSFEKVFNPIVNYGGKVFDVTRSSVYQNKINDNDYSFDAFITYDNTFNEAHNLTVTLGTTVYQNWGNGLNATGFDVPNNSWEFADISLANGLNTDKATGSYAYKQRRLSYFTRVQYDYRGRYLVSGMFRRDASTKFGPDYAAAYFPSATLGWVISEEAFMQDVDLIDLLKLRLSFGYLGSDKIGDFRYLSTLDGEATYVFNDNLVYGRAIGVLPNTGIQWEQSQQFDAGLDLALWNEKVTLTADYFNKRTESLLIEYVPVSGILGTAAPGSGSPTINAGTVRNSGFEFAAGLRGGKPDKFSYRVNYNFTYINNEVLEVDNGTGFIASGNFSVGQPLAARMQVGYPMGYFFGYETDGIFQSQDEVDAHPSQIALGAEASPGDIRYKDLNGDGVINSDDRTIIGDPIPDFIMGLNVSFNFYGFDFLAYAYASIGNEMIRNYERTQPNVNRLEYVLDRWTGPGTSDYVPRVTTAATANNVLSDFFVEDASYLRLQKISLGYTIPMSITEKAYIKQLRLFVAVNNLFTLTKYTGYDPAASSGEPIGGGIDYGFYPAARTYLFGIGLNF